MTQRLDIEPPTRRRTPRRPATSPARPTTRRAGTTASRGSASRRSSTSSPRSSPAEAIRCTCGAGTSGPLSLIHLQVMTVLQTERLDADARARRVARRLAGVSATGIVDRMEQRGLIERRRDDDDRRVIRVAARRRTAASSSPASPRTGAQRLGYLLDELSDDELDGFLRGARALPARPRPIPRTSRCRRAHPSHRRGHAMIDLFRQYLPTYRWPLVLVLILLSIQAIANLFLPELNADIINNGVVKGDIGYILRTGGFMLLVTGDPRRRRRHRRLLERKGLDGLRAGRPERDLPQGRDVLAGRGQHLRRGQPDHPQHQRRPAGPAGPAAGG